MIQKLMVVNRGEIAVRVIRAAREMGIRTVAVFSDADADAMHTQLADEAAPLGPPEPAASYLNVEKILEAAARHGCDAVHPGYGFLSERPEFVEAVEAAGLTFVGPSAAAMRALGAKIDAKRLAVGAGVPVVPGYFEPGASAQDLKEAAEKIGYPVLLKASAGGGGRGMRVVSDPAQFDAELRTAQSEAEKAFGDGSMMVEKLVERPRHVEVQIIADSKGNVAPLFERECSIQRRHQKILEESGSPLMIGPKAMKGLWESMRDAAVALAKAAGYSNAGTVEFIVDEASGEFYFLEVNARLQVEHPVTEMVTGVDLVQWQLRVASGLKLQLPKPLMEGNRDALRGHAIEARVVAENPEKGFLPSAGRILAWAEPKLPGVRVDTGYGAGTEVPRYYDSMLAKVIAFGATRAEAIAKLKAALYDFHILGVDTNVAFLIEVLSHPEFLAGKFDTGFIGREYETWHPGDAIPVELGKILEFAAHDPSEHRGRLPRSGRTPAWGQTDGFRNVSVD
ncbi:MAG: biotin carboxylase N-terminal domain-containing protein [Fimbriimonadaceae bacterium]